jgi:hypothetical protein
LTVREMPITIVAVDYFGNSSEPSEEVSATKQ